MFIGRKNELKILSDAYRSASSEFCVLFGRRRIGKSTLLEEFTNKKPLFFYLAGKEAKSLQLKRFVRELGETVSDPLTGKVGVSDWNDALMLLDRNLIRLREKKEGTKAIIVFDEFQWMCNGSPELLSDIQRFWDKQWKDSGNVFLILCGSSISFMLGEVLSRKSPLFGRRTFSFELKPFKINEAKLFLPFKGDFEIVETYMSVGGVPKYLEIFNSRISFKQCMLRHAFSPTGFLYDEVRFILSEQLKETENYFMLIEQMSGGAKEVVALEKSTGIPSGQIMYYLERLQMLGFVSRHVPVGMRSNTKKVRYRLDDYYLRFCFNFIQSNRQAISSGFSNMSFEKITKNRWHSYTGIAFEHFVRDHAEIIVAKLSKEAMIKRTGSFWQHPTKRKAGFQIDLIIETDEEITFICECKWSRKKSGSSVLDELQRKVELYPNVQKHTIIPVIVSAAGVSESVMKEKGISVITIDDFFNY